MAANPLLGGTGMSGRSAEEGANPAGEGASPAHTNKDEKNMHLYNILGVGKRATDEDIKKAYRKLALRYHPDKNPDGDPEKTEKFKEINYAHGVLSNPSKRKIYDEMGDAGLKLMEQFGEDEKLLQFFLKPWFKWVFYGIGLLTCGFCCCCCFCCCCYFCCGKCKPPQHDENDQFDAPDNGSNSDSSPVIAQPAPSSDRPAVIVMGAPEQPIALSVETVDEEGRTPPRYGATD